MLTTGLLPLVVVGHGQGAPAGCRLPKRETGRPAAALRVPTSEANPDPLARPLRCGVPFLPGAVGGVPAGASRGAVALLAPASVATVADAGGCGATVAFGARATGWPAPEVRYVVGATPITSPYVFPIGTSVVTVRVANAWARDSSSFTVTVADTQRPSLVAPAPVQVAADAGTGGTARERVALGMPQVGDNCATALTVRHDAPASFPAGTTTVTWTATDGAGNTATATQRVTVTDEEAPVVRTRNVTVELDAQGKAAITLAQVDNGSGDNCRLQALGLDKTSFNCTNLGVNTVLVTAIDQQGNTGYGTVVVTVEDRLAPTVRVRDLHVRLVHGTATITAAQLDNGSLDNCGIWAMQVRPATFGPAQLGPNPVVLTVVDAHGNTTTATATVTVTDSLPTPAEATPPANAPAPGPSMATAGSAGAVSHIVAPSLAVFPTPATDEVLLDLVTPTAQPVAIRLASVLGQPLHQQTTPLPEGHNRLRLDTHTLPEGVYLLTVQQGASTLTRRVLIAR